MSLKNTGVTIFDLDTLEPVLITSIKSNPKEARGKRLKYIADAILDLVAQFPPREICIEQGFSKWNKETHALQQLLGVVLYILHQHEPVLYAPKTIKKLVTGNGQASKDVVRKIILKRYPNIKFENHDQSDSFACCICWLIKNKKIKW